MWRSRFFSSRRNRDVEPRWDIHDYDEIVMVQDGHSRLVIGNEIRQAVADDIIIVKAQRRMDSSISGTGCSSRSIFM
jgi:hypothetical protein